MRRNDQLWELMKRHFILYLVVWLMCFMGLLCLCMSLGGCKATGNIVETHDIAEHDTVRIVSVETRTDTIYRAKVDSIWLRDSIYVFQRGDTLTIDRWHERYLTKIDTLYLYTDWAVNDSVLQRTDSIETVTETVEVHARMTWWDWVISVSGYLFLASVAFMTYLFVRQASK